VDLHRAATGRVAAGTGEVQITDEDEFAAACERGYIAAAEAVATRQAADQVARLI